MELNLNKRKPKDIVFDQDLKIEWKDGSESVFPYFNLRDACPCATCVDELTGKKVLNPASIAEDIHIKKAEYVGHYGLRINWSDGHDTGIYAFRALRELFDRTMEEGGWKTAPPAN